MAPRVVEDSAHMVANPLPIEEVVGLVEAVFHRHRLSHGSKVGDQQNAEWMPCLALGRHAHAAREHGTLAVLSRTIFPLPT